MLLQTLIKQSMKTVTLIISSLFLFMVLGVSAQQHGPQHRGQRGHMNPEEMVKRQVEHMKTELKLNEQQEKQVKDLLTENFKQRGQHEKDGRTAKPFPKENLDGRTIQNLPDQSGKKKTRNGETPERNDGQTWRTKRRTR